MLSHFLGQKDTEKNAQISEVIEKAIDAKLKFEWNELTEKKRLTIKIDF